MKKRAIDLARAMGDALQEELKHVQNNYDRMEASTKKRVIRGVTSITALLVGSFAVYKAMKIHRKHVLGKSKK